MKVWQKIIKKNNDPYGNNTVTLAFLGDSVTNGCFELYKTSDNGFDTVYNHEQVYHNKLKKMINLLYPKATLNIINAGISGDTAVGGLKRLERDVNRFNPDLVVVCFGLNDSQKGLDGIDEYKNSLDKIFKQISCECIFLTPNMMATHVDGEISDTALIELANNISSIQKDGTMDKYIETAKEVCVKNNITICDCYGIWKKLSDNGVDTTELLSNRLNHPTFEMHNLFAVELLRIILS